ncbi:Cytochrome P450 4C1 [Frankliniella fusca]|uniref:Cytochrome P450 4C1 n=1 Tax=Frankliniella fusca TaxID=407009 RepID=A0AAE1HKP7_9NEOP|nr:Cytochrome P450 4C1 [Frankliniella fusca]
MSLHAVWLALETALPLAFLTVVMLGVALYFHPTLCRARRIAKDYPQYSSSLPVLGHLLHILKPRDELFRMLRQWPKMFGSPSVIVLGGKTFFNLSDPESVEVVLSSSKHTTKGRAYEFLRPWLGDGLLTSAGEKWHSRRKLLTPAFHFKILDQFIPHLEEQAAHLADELGRHVSDGQGADVDVVPIVSKVTLRSICVTAMGKVDFATDSDDAFSEKSYFEAIHSVGETTALRIVRPWLWPPLLFKLTSTYNVFRKNLGILHGYTRKVIADRKATLSVGKGDDDAAADVSGNKRRSRLRPFLDVLLNAQRRGEQITDRDIREEVDTFMFEGHDTTSMAISWALELLGRHPEEQERLAEEVRAAGEDWDSVSRLPYLDRVYKECLRLRPSVPFISRCLESDAVLPDGRILPTSAMASIHIYDLHRHPDHFPDPERFDPDRFLPDREQSRHPFAYLPFSAGPRNCIGKRFATMEVKLFMAAVVRRFHIRSSMPEQLDAVADLVLRPRDGINLWSRAVLVAGSPRPHLVRTEPAQTQITAAMLVLLLLPALMALGLLVLISRARAKHAKLCEDFPAPPAAPIIGHAKDFWGNEEHIFNTTKRFCRELGRQFVTIIMNENTLNLCDADGAEAVMVSSKHIKKGPLYTFLTQWLGRGLLTNYGPSWHHRRKLLTPAFHFKILDEFGPLLQNHSQRLVESLSALATEHNGLVEVVLPVSKTTLGSICETAMGVNLHTLGKEDEYFDCVRILGASVLYRMIRPWLWKDFVYNLTPHGRETNKALKKLHTFTKQVIQERKNNHESTGTSILDGNGMRLGKRRLAFLDMLLAAQREDPTLADDDIRQEVDTFMFEGHETTAMAISWTLFLLGNHPEVQERVREEAQAAGDDWQAVVGLPYLEMVVKESLRLYPPVLYIARENDKGIQIGDKLVPADVNLDIQIYLIHRDPNNFPDPDRFDPERFSPEQEKTRHPFAYVPFSGGLRNCIGRRYAMMELKIMLAAVVKAFSFTSVKSEKEMEYKPELVLRPKGGIFVNLKPLTSNI